jgi:hypothetical protein
MEDEIEKKMGGGGRAESQGRRKRAAGNIS